MILISLLCLLLPGLASAQTDDKQVRLSAPTSLVESGLLRHILPRFSLKTQVRVTLVDDGTQDGVLADIVLGTDGVPLFEGAGGVWHMAVLSGDHPGTQRLAEWLQSDIGQRTVFDYAPAGVALFTPPQVAPVAVVEVVYDGDAALGHEVSLRACKRCHVVDKASSGSGIGSTPSFAVLRSFEDWELRFAAFYALNPHPAFTQIDEVTEPFPIDRPSPIVPIRLTLDELDGVLAYVAAMAAADLGAPLDHQ